MYAFALGTCLCIGYIVWSRPYNMPNAGVCTQCKGIYRRTHQIGKWGYYVVHRRLSRGLVLGFVLVWLVPVAVPVRFIFYIERRYLQMWIRTQGYGKVPTENQRFPAVILIAPSRIYKYKHVITYSRPIVALLIHLAFSDSLGFLKNTRT